MYRSREGFSFFLANSHNRRGSSSTVALRILGRRRLLVKPIVNARHTDRLKKVKIQVNG